MRNENFFKSLKTHQISAKQGFGLPGILKSSKNEYLEYPCKGVLYVFEQGVDLSIIAGIFHQEREDGSLGAPCRVYRPVFEYNGG